MILGPLALLAIIRGKRKASRIDQFLALGVILLALGATVAGCVSVPPTGTMTLPAPTSTPSPTLPPTQTVTPGPTETATVMVTFVGATSKPTQTLTVTIICTSTPSGTPRVSFSLDEPLISFARPAGLRPEDGELAYNSIIGMITGNLDLGLDKAWWFTMSVIGAGDDALTLRELLAILLIQEVGFGLTYNGLDKEGIPTDYMLIGFIVDATTHKYNQFCSAGSFSADCLNKFWGYYEPIRTVANNESTRNDILYLNIYKCPPHNKPYKGEALLKYGDDIVNRKSIGGQSLDVVSEWVTIKQEKNPIAYYLFLSNVKATYRRDFNGNGKGRIFLVMSPNEQNSNCADVGLGAGCNLTGAH